MKQKIKKWGIPLLAVFLTAVFPAVFLYCNNANEADFSEILAPLMAFACAGLVLFLIASLFTRHAAKAAIISILFILLLENFAAVEDAFAVIIPGIRYWHVLPLTIFILLHVAYFVWKRMPDELSKIVITVVCVVFGALTVVNAAIAVPGEINKYNARKMEEEQKLAEKENHVEADENLPNIYILVFDEFSGFHQMEKYYNYDNVTLKESLEDKGFTISYDSHNESIITVTVTTNLVNLDYIVDNDDPASEKKVLRENGALFEVAEGKGYDVRKLTTTGLYGEDYSVDGVTSSSAAVSGTGETLETILMKKTILYPLAGETVDDTMEIVRFLEDKSNIPTTPTLTLAHLAISHTPFYYDENGNLISVDDWDNWVDDSIYLGVYQYNSKIIMAIAENLVENDPNALIIMMSDHGARASTNQDLFMEKFELNDMNNIFNVFYYKGEDLSEYTNLSGVNTLRMLLNKALGTTYEEVEVPVDDYVYK